MSKDPAGTIQRITEALEIAATEVDRKHRFEGIYKALAPLQPEEFPEAQDGNLFSDIKSAALTLCSGRNNSRLGARCLKQLWELYWKMSANREYE